MTKLVVDGRAIEGNLIPLSSEPGRTIEVEAFVAAPMRAAT
jgi:hypothetical protein